MDYKTALLAERSRTQMDRLARQIGNDPAEFRKIVDIIFTEADPLPMRACWLMEVITRDRPELASPYARKFINAFNTIESDSLRRGLLVALGKQKIPGDLQSKMLDTCFGLMLSPDRPVAVKVFAMEVAFNIVQEHPDLAAELKSIIDDQWERNSVAFRARGKMVLKRLEKITKMKV